MSEDHEAYPLSPADDVWDERRRAELGAASKRFEATVSALRIDGDTTTHHVISLYGIVAMDSMEAIVIAAARGANRLAGYGADIRTVTVIELGGSDETTIRAGAGGTRAIAEADRSADRDPH
jgi:hypothetical protein